MNTNRPSKISVLAAASAAEPSPAQTNLVPPLAIPRRPAAIPRAMQPEYRALIVYLDSIGAWKPERLPLVENYLVALALMRRAAEEMEAEPLLVEGKPNPLLDVVRRFQERTQSAAKVLGVPVGGMTAPGRPPKAPVVPVKAKTPAGAWSL